MSRTLKDDYSDLLGFFDSYSLKDTYEQKYLDDIIKPIHKSYYSALTLIAELKHQGATPDISCANKEKQKKVFWLHLSESFSELGSSFFLIINGCYKASEQVLRSSIENFVKALGSLDVADINQTKNIYEVFDKSSKSRFFSEEFNKKIHQKLYREYSQLCSTVHTGTEQDMQNISALGDFPAIDIDRSKLVRKKYINIVQSYLSSLSLMFDQNFHAMHHKNLDIVQLSLNKAVVKQLYNK